MRSPRPALVGVALAALLSACARDAPEGGASGAAGTSGSASAPHDDGSVPSAHFDLAAALGDEARGARASGGVPFVDDVDADGFGVVVPVPPLLPPTGVVRTADGLLAHARGARLHRARDVVEGDQVRFSVRLRTLSRGPLRLTRIEGECKCIDARGYLLDGMQRMAELWPGDEVPAGADFEILVHLDTSDRPGDLQLEGILDYRGAAEPLKFAIAADVKPVYVVAPARALVPAVMLGQRHESSVRLTSPLAERFRLELDDSALPPHVRIVPRPVDADDAGFARRYVLDLHIGANAPDAALPRTHSVPISVVTAPGPDQSLALSYPRTLEVGYRTELPVQFVQRIAGAEGGPKLVSGSALAFGILEPGATQERRVTLAVRDDWTPEHAPKAFLVEGASVGRTPLPEGSLEWTWTQERGTYHLDVRLTNPDDGVAGPTRGQIQVRVGHPDVPSLRISLSALLR